MSPPVVSVRLALREERRKHVQLLVVVMLRRGLVEVAHHILRGLAGIGVGAVLRHVVAQALQQRQHALDPLVAGGKHLEGLLEGRGGRGRER